MNTCLCGNAVDLEGAPCERCTALYVLGLDSSASDNEIEKTYRVLVKVWHPDRFQSDAKLKEAADEKLKSINAAYTFLSSARADRTRKRAAKKSGMPSAGQQPAARPQRGAFLDSALAISILLRGVVLLFGLAISAALLFGMDRWLSSNPATSSFYDQYRSRLFFTLQTNVTDLKQHMQGILPKGTPAPAIPPTGPEPSDLSAASSAADQPPIAVPPPHVPMPYVTVGLTPDEVTTVMGAPLSATRDAMRYKTATFYFHDGKVAGWKVDPALIPLRVKLWPNNHSDPHTVTFTIGSTKSDVIAVQGTPTMLSEDKLAYGASEVFFESGRVIGWNDNHSSAHLHVPPR
jgi:hypothetical protein